MHELVEPFKKNPMALMGAIVELRALDEETGDFLVIAYAKLVDVSVTDFFRETDVAFAGPRHPGELWKNPHGGIPASEGIVCFNCSRTSGS